MKIHVEHYGDRLGVMEGGLAKLIAEKKVQLLVTVISDDEKQRHEFILNREQALNLAEKIKSCIDNPILAENGFQVV